LTPDDGLRLLETHDLAALGRAADEVTRRLHPENYRTYNIDRNINYTNVCAAVCDFCAFYRKSGDADAYVLPRGSPGGVDVKIMVSGIRNDNWLARMNSVRLMGPLLAHHIEIFEYNRTMLHHKTMVVDGLWATIGTTNFDNRSFAHNDENNVCVHDLSLAEQLQSTFMEDLGVCERVDHAAWRRRGGWSRCQEFVAALLEDQA
jgi:phosphatidylserine/phosphatidylglycerophosphate/cardiolipin synthase-like enzyme